MSDQDRRKDDENLLATTPDRRLRSVVPPNTDISNSTTKKFSTVVAEYMAVHKLSSLNPAVVTQAADHTGLQGDSYHQWDQYNPPTPTVNPRAYYDPEIFSSDHLLEVETPSLDAYQFDNWAVGDSLKMSNGSKNKESRVPAAGTTESTPSAFNIGTPGMIPTPTTFNVGTTESVPSSFIVGVTEPTPTTYNVGATCSSSNKAPNAAEAPSNRKEQQPVFPFLPARHHLQLPVSSPTNSYTSNRGSMTSFWNDYERTANGADLTPMRYLNYSGSQNHSTPGSAFSNSAFESQIDTVMEPDSLEKKSINPDASVCNLSAKSGRHSLAHSSTVASCLPQLLMSEYTESPPYMPSASFNYDVIENRGAQQGRNNSSNNNSNNNPNNNNPNNNNDSVGNSGRLRASQINVQHSAERSNIIRNSFSDSRRTSVTSRNETSDQPIAAAPYLVLDSLADELEEKENKRRYMVLGIFLMFIGALIHIIGLAILVYVQNKKFAPYTGIYPNGCKDVILIEGAMTSHGVNCTEYLAQQALEEEGVI